MKKYIVDNVIKDNTNFLKCTKCKNYIVLLCNSLAWFLHFFLQLSYDNEVLASAGSDIAVGVWMPKKL